MRDPLGYQLPLSPRGKSELDCQRVSTEQYDGTNFDIFLNHRFYSWYKLRVNFGYGDNDYNNDRNDDDYRVGLGLDYLFLRRVTLGAGYIYFRRDSSERGESWTNNLFMGTVTLRY